MESAVQNFYKGRSLLVTGGSGLMGKVLIEKLLYSVPDLKRIYILMRPKRGKTVSQRMDEIWKAPLFERLREEKPDEFKKVKALQGDVLLEGLGLTDDALKEISEEVSIVFHFAATLKLEAPVKDCVDMNTLGTLRTLKVAKKLKNFTLFLHLSTAFCYPDYEILGEKFHPPSVNPHDMIRAIEWLDDKQIDMLTPSLLGPHPNGYTFSKRLAEALVNEYFHEMPAVIIRPSIVCPAFVEPVQGWVDNLNGPTGIMIGAAKGAIRTMLCNGKYNAQVIPVDIAINAIISIAYKEGSKPTKPENIPVYNVTSGDVSPTTWGEVLRIGKDHGRKYPFEWPLWYPEGTITTNHALHEFRRIFYHLLPAYFIDFLLLIFRQKRFMIRVQQKISQGLYVLQYFTMRPWVFETANFKSIHENLNEKDKKLFPQDMAVIDRQVFVEICIEGGRKYCLKESTANIPKNRMYHNFLWVLHIIFHVLFYLWLISLFASRLDIVKDTLLLGGPVVKALPFVGTAVFPE